MRPMHQDPRLDVLQAAVLALMATLPPDRAATARALFLAGVADLEERPADAAADAAAAGTVAALLEVLPSRAATSTPTS